MAKILTLLVLLMTAVTGAVAQNYINLSTLEGEGDYEAQNGDVLTGETTSYKVTIAAGATVTLDNVTISGEDYCIKCAGDATIILKDGTTNTLTSTSWDYPALWAGNANTTLTIQGSTGVLNVTSGEYCAGIGGGYNNTNSTCGNIRIEGGVITAQGGQYASGIGTDCGTATCGDIIITGGTITAIGGSNAAGIGTGSDSYEQAVCGDITIANTVTEVTATAGENAPYSIGKGDGADASCGTITIGGTKYWENNAAVGDGATYLATNPLIYDPAAIDLTMPAYDVELEVEYYNEVTLTDGSAITALNDYKEQEIWVNYTRSFTEGKTSTVCLPFAYTKKEGDGSFYAFTNIEKNGSGEYVATMTEPGTTTLEDNTPYLYLPNATGDVDFGGAYTIPASLTAGSTTSNGWTFKGTYETIEWETAPATPTYGFSAGNANDGIKQGEFVKVGSYVRIQPMRCYLENASFAGARGMKREAAEPLPETIKVRLIGANGEVTAIGTISTKTGEGTIDNGAWYSMDGRRTEGKPTAKGVYVNNGKKVIIK